MNGINRTFLSLGLLCLLVLSACAPQAQFVKTRSDLYDLRDEVKETKAKQKELQASQDSIRKRLDALDTNVQGTVDAQKVMADYGARADQLATDIQLLQGRLEENNFRIAELGQKLDDKSFRIAELTARVEQLESKVQSLGSGQGIASAPSATAERKAPRSADPSEAYRQAMNDYRGGNFDLALAGFQNYLEQFPDASLAPAAQYWVGECYYARKKFKSAIESFQKVIKNYPKSEKVAGAKLKIGYSYLNENNRTKAREWLHRVVKEHPKTEEAGWAKEKLHRIGK